MDQDLNRLILVDGHALIHRAYHAYPPLTTSKGELVNAVYGFASILLSTFDTLKPKYAVMAFDKKGPTFRHKKFVDYKGTRVRPDKEMLMQIPRIKQLVGAFNIPIFEQKGFEADDVIGTLAKLASVPKLKIKSEKLKTTISSFAPPSPEWLRRPSKATADRQNSKLKKNFSQAPRAFSNIETIIVTGDQDALQLINERVKVFMPARGRFIPARMYDQKEVELKLGIQPNQIVDYKALTGDSSDNIPGVDGIGPKTAQILLAQYKTLENIYKNLSNIPEKARIKLETGKESAILSQELAQIHFNAPVTLELSKCVVSDYNKREVIKLFEELEFKSLIKRLENSGKKEDLVKNQVKQKSEEQMELF